MTVRLYAFLFFAVWGFFSFLIFLYRAATANKRRLKNEQKEREMTDLKEAIANFCKEVEQKDALIKSLEKDVSELRAATAPLPEPFHGGRLVDEYRDVSIYVPDEKIDKMVLGNPLYISRSTKNRYDREAIALTYKGEELAFFERGKYYNKASCYLESGAGAFALITFIDKETKTVKVHLGFYKGGDFSDISSMRDDSEEDFEEEEGE